MSFGLGQASAISMETASCDTIADTSTIDPSTPWIAAADGNVASLQQALQHLGLQSLTAIDPSGYSVWHAAASYSQRNVAEWILASCQDVDDAQTAQLINGVDNDGDSALHYASTADMAQFLVEMAGVDSQIRNKAGWTALEAKQQEMEELKQDKDNYDEDDSDVVLLNDSIAYLVSLVERQQ